MHFDFPEKRLLKGTYLFNNRFKKETFWWDELLLYKERSLEFLQRWTASAAFTWMNLAVREYRPGFSVLLPYFYTQ